MTSSLWYRLLFTRDDDLDLLQVLFLVWVLFTGVCIALVGGGVWRLPVPAFALLGSTFVTLAIAGTPKWIAALIAQSKAPGDVARGIATSGREAYGPGTLDWDIGGGGDRGFRQRDAWDRDENLLTHARDDEF